MAEEPPAASASASHRHASKDGDHPCQRLQSRNFTTQAKQAGFAGKMFVPESVRELLATNYFSGADGKRRCKPCRRATPGGRPKARWNAEREGVTRTLFQKKITKQEKERDSLDPGGFLAEVVRKTQKGTPAVRRGRVTKVKVPPQGSPAGRVGEAMKLSKHCVPNFEDRCTQCRDYAPRKRVCPVYRVMIKQEQAAVRQVRKDFREFLKTQSV